MGVIIKLKNTAKINFDRQNERVIDWMQRTVSSLRGNSNALGITHRSDSPSKESSVTKIHARVKRKGDIIEVVSFKFPRTLIWPHKGAGKGQGGLKGSVWYNKLGIKHKTNPDSLGKMNTGNRIAKTWFNDVIESPDGVEQLATIVAEESGDAIVNNLLIK